MAKPDGPRAVLAEFYITRLRASTQSASTIW